MSDYEVTLVNDNMQGEPSRNPNSLTNPEFYVKFKGPEDSK